MASVSEWQWRMVDSGRVGWPGSSDAEVRIVSPLAFSDVWWVMRGQYGTILAEVRSSVGKIVRTADVTWDGFCNLAPKGLWGRPGSGIRADGYLIPGPGTASPYTLEYELFVSDRRPVTWTAVGQGRLTQRAAQPEELYGYTTKPYIQRRFMVFRDGKLYWWITLNHRKQLGQTPGKIRWTYHGWSQWPEVAAAWERTDTHKHPFSGGAGGQSDGAEGPPREGEEWTYLVVTDADDEVDIRTGTVPAHSMWARLPSNWGGGHTCRKFGAADKRIRPGHSVDYAIPASGAKWVDIRIYDTAMRLVRRQRVIAPGFMLSAGGYRWHWNGRNNLGETVAIGWYAIEAEARLKLGTPCTAFGIDANHEDRGTGNTPWTGGRNDNVSRIPPKLTDTPKEGSPLWLLLPIAALYFLKGD